MVSSNREVRERTSYIPTASAAREIKSKVFIFILNVVFL
jgi:hypothetical protein